MAQVGIFVGTVYGNALMVAEEAQAILQQLGHTVALFEEGTLSDWQNYADQHVLVVTSTTGQGDLPDTLAPLFSALRDSLGEQRALRYGVIALGDRGFTHFCGAGHRVDSLLQEQGATRLGEVLEVDVQSTPEPEAVTSPWVSEWARRLVA
ncbi:flavodoxin [Edwardsiella tarda]|uniref:flavodoxin n=1 Tax=Edwardsiella tarda TaxID=636 RepID=UPI003B500145